MNERVKEVRKELNLTLEEFGNRIGFTRSSMSNIETGYRNVTERLILAICREFSVNEEWLRTGAGDMFLVTREDYIEKVSRSYNLDKLDEAIINTYMSFPPEKRAVIKEFILAASGIGEVYDEEAKAKARIDKEVEAFRKDLEAELKGVAKSSAIDEQSGNGVKRITKTI